MPDAAGTGSNSSRSGTEVRNAPGRLSGKAEFERVFRGGWRFRGSVLKIVCSGNTLGLIRLGFSVSRKSGCAVERNRFRRRVRETLRQRLEMPPGTEVDMVVSPSVKLSMVTKRSMEEDLEAFVALLSQHRQP